MTSHHAGSRTVGLDPELERPGRAEGDRLASVEVGQRQRIARKDPEQPDGVAGPVGEGRIDLTTLDVAQDREGSLAADEPVAGGRVDLPHRLVGSCCRRNRKRHNEG
jgi:hypothetical protein